jgi:hypothetical protein
MLIALQNQTPLLEEFTEQIAATNWLYICFTRSEDRIEHAVGTGRNSMAIFDE